MAEYCRCVRATRSCRNIKAQGFAMSEDNGQVSQPVTAAAEAIDDSDKRVATPVHGRAESASAPASEEVETALHYLSFGLAVSLRYHAKRWRWFEGLHNLAAATSILSATAAFATVISEYGDVGKWIAINLAAVTALDLVMGFGRRATTHSELYQRFSALAAEIARAPSISAADVRNWTADRLLLEASEPPSLGTLNVICHNEEVEARGLGDEHLRRLNILDRCLAQVGSLPRIRYRPLAPPPAGPGVPQV